MITTTMTMPEILQRSFELLIRNVLLLVPCVIGEIVNVMLRGIFLVQPLETPDSQLLTLTNTIAHWIIYGLSATIITLIAVVAVTSMAGRVWEQGSATIADGLSVVSEAGSELYYTLSQLTGLVLIAFPMAVLTGGLSLLAVLYFMMYAVSSAVIGRFPGFQAIRESATIAKRHVKETVGIVFVFVLLSLMLQVVRYIVTVLPFVGSLVMLVLNGAVIAYMTLVVVGVYIDVHRRNPTMLPAGD